MEITKKTATILGSTIVIAALADIVIFSIGASKGAGGKFKLVIPGKNDMIQILFIGLAMGLAIDFVTANLENLIMTPEERELSKLLKAEIKSINNGEKKGLTPIKIAWKNI